MKLICKYLAVFSLSVLLFLPFVGRSSAYADSIIGTKVPEFSIPDAVTSKTVSIDDLLAGHKAVVVIFVSTVCPYSKAYNGRMSDLFTKYSALGVSLVGIDSNITEEEADITEYKFEQHLPFPILYDEYNKVADLFKANHTPEAYVIDNTGTIVYHGRIDNSVELSGVQTHDLANAIDQALAGTPVLVPETKAFGCSIKRTQDQ